MPKEYGEPRNGGYYVVGTRVPLDSIVQAFQEGMSAETIDGEFDTLTLAQVYGAIVWFRRCWFRLCRFRGNTRHLAIGGGRSEWQLGKATGQEAGPTLLGVTK